MYTGGPPSFRFLEFGEVGAGVVASGVVASPVVAVSPSPLNASPNSRKNCCWRASGLSRAELYVSSALMSPLLRSSAEMRGNVSGCSPLAMKD